MASHEIFCEYNPQRKSRSPQKRGVDKGYVPWNKGKCTGIKPWNKGIKGSTSGRGSTPEKEQLRIAKIKQTAKEKHCLGGHRHGSGRGKKGWYKGIFCDSSWELAVVIYAKDQNMSIKRCNEFRTYEWEGQQHKYLPDFIMDGVITEVKGYRTPQWNAKEAANPDVKVLDAPKIKPILEYVTSKYGKDFIKLYEES